MERDVRGEARRSRLRQRETVDGLVLPVDTLEDRNDRLSDESSPEDEAGQILELREERLVPRKSLIEVGQVLIRKEIEEVPGRLEVAVNRDEVQLEHVPVGKVVTEKVAPWEEDGAVVVPVYEEQLVVVKRLVMREQIRVRKVETTETQLFQDTLRREKLVIDNSAGEDRVHEVYPDDFDERPKGPEGTPRRGVLDGILRRVLE